MSPPHDDPTARVLASGFGLPYRVTPLFLTGGGSERRAAPAATTGRPPTVAAGVPGATGAGRMVSSAPRDAASTLDDTKAAPPFVGDRLTAAAEARRLPFRDHLGVAEALADVPHREVVELVRREVRRTDRERTPRRAAATAERGGRLSPDELTTSENARALLGVLRRLRRDERFRLGQPG